MSKALAYAPAVNTAKLIYQVMNQIHSMVLFQSTNTQSFLCDKEGILLLARQ